MASAGLLSTACCENGRGGKYSYSRREWVSSLPKSLHDVPITKLAIPGTHNSGAFSLNENDDVAPDEPGIIQPLANVPGVGPLVKQVLKKWSLCQKLDFTQQLNTGIRFFDLRVSTKRGTNDLYLVHGLFGPKVIKLIEAVLLFLNEHPHELVILDFNHFYNMEHEHHIQLITLLIFKFDAKICHRRCAEEITINALWAQQKQIIIIYQDDCSTDFEEMWTKASIHSPWANTMDSMKCIQFLTEFFSQPRTTGFTVCQGVLTPTAEAIMRYIFTDCSLEVKNKTFTPHHCSWLGEISRIYDFPLNIVTADFVEYGDFVQKVIDLNYEKAQTFNN